MTDKQNQSGGISRRTVAKGAAWSVPAVVVATAAPAVAASGGPPTLRFLDACKNPGASCKTRPKGYSFYFEVCNNTGKTIYIYDVTVVSTDPVLDLTFAYGVPALPFAVANGECRNVEFVTTSTNSANLSFTATLDVVWGHNPTPPDPDGHPAVRTVGTVLGTRPDCPCPAA